MDFDFKNKQYSEEELLDESKKEVKEPQITDDVAKKIIEMGRIPI